MSRLDAAKVTMFRTDSAGRTVYVRRFRQDVYLIRDPAEATRVATAVTNNRVTSFIGLAAALLVSTKHPVLALGMFLVAIWSTISRRRLLATLEKSTDRADDLPPVDRLARRRAYSMAMGRRYFWDQIAAGVVIAVIIAGGLYAANQLSAAHREPPSSTTFVIAAFGMLAFCAYGIVSAVLALRSYPPDAEQVPTPG